MRKPSEQNWHDEDCGEECISDRKQFATLPEIDEIDVDEFSDQEEARRFANLTRTYDR